MDCQFVLNALWDREYHLASLDNLSKLLVFPVLRIADRNEKICIDKRSLVW
jgi:hypothetical protein